MAPYRMLEPVLGVVPLDGMALLNAAAASEGGHRYLAAWLRDAEAKWAAHSNRAIGGGTAHDAARAG